MHSKRLTSWLLGAWIGCSLFMFLIATHNFKAVPDLLAEPGGAKELIERLGPDGAKMLLRYHSSELNRFYFQAWEFVQIGVIAVVASLAWSTMGPRKTGRVLLVLIALILLAERSYITPEIVRIGRMMDFTPADTVSAARAQFWTLHGLYSGVEVLKVMLLAGLSLMLFSLRHDKGPQD